MEHLLMPPSFPPSHTRTRATMGYRRLELFDFFFLLLLEEGAAWFFLDVNGFRRLVCEVD